jgi:uncharacterized protein YndB with AHSA1/START domain
MTSRAEYSPGHASGTTVHKIDGPNWELVVVRELHHPPEKVWQALTNPADLHEWAPFDADANLGNAGTKVNLTTVGAPSELISETTVTRADAPRSLEYKWGDNEMRWELEPRGNGTKLTLWTSIDRRFVSMGAAGWQICFDVLDHLLDGDPLGRFVGMETMKFEGWQRLNREYAKQFGAEQPTWPSQPTQQS